MNTKAAKGFSLIAFLVLPLVALRASADDAGADAGTDADAGAMAADPDAGTDADADAAAEPPPFDQAPFSDEKSPMPKDDEWKAAPLVSLSPRSGGTSCNKQRIREWIRIECGNLIVKITMLGGNAEGVKIKLAPFMNEWDQFPEKGEVVFPVRRGDRRVFEWQSLEFGYRGASNATSMYVISESWMPGDEKPVILMR